MLTELSQPDAPESVVTADANRTELRAHSQRGSQRMLRLVPPADRSKPGLSPDDVARLADYVGILMAWERNMCAHNDAINRPAALLDAAA